MNTRPSSFSLKKIFFLVGFLFVILLFIFLRVPHVSRGEAQGTTYLVRVYCPLWVLPSTIDSLVTETLAVLDKAASGYRPDSEVSALNTSGLSSPSPVLARLMAMSAVVYRVSDGAFDPSAGRLFALWDFRKQGWEIPSPEEIQTFLAEHPSGMPQGIRGRQFWNFDAIAQGLSVDMIAEALEQKGLTRYFVEVGGEVRVRGHLWRVGISYPDKTASQWDLFGILRLRQGAVATSGTYRRVIADGRGQTRSHIIDPRTGYPVTHTVVSATVLHPSCGMADALATAVLVLGAQEGLALLDRVPEASGFVITHEGAAGYQVHYSARFDQQAWSAIR